MRSTSEILFRLRQEFANAALAVLKPGASAPPPAALPMLPAPELAAAAAQGTGYARHLTLLADEILTGHYRLLGYELQFDAATPWRRDVIHNRESSLDYFRLVPYLDPARVGDHKIVWELSRHQHLIVLAQAFRITGRADYLAECKRQWESWVAANPFQRGIHWASALEVAFRALSWIWVYHLVGSALDDVWRRRFVTELYRHGLHLEYNLSFYFSPNTHLLGEAVALHAIGVLFPDLPRAREWVKLAGGVVARQLERQTLADGAHFERSTYYHVYALDFFLFHYLLAGRPRDFEPALLRMAEYLSAVQGPARRIPLIGDDDGGRMFVPFGPHDEFGRATLAVCACLFNRPEWLNDPADLYPQAMWWLGAAVLERTGTAPPPAQSCVLASGTSILATGKMWVLARGGGFGPYRAGHSHSDSLAIVLRRGDADVLIDAGTYTYMGDAKWRNWFRGSAAHNTIRIAERDHATAAGPFAWDGKPAVRLNHWNSTPEYDYWDASCGYAGCAFLHRRRLVFVKPDCLFVIDQISGAPPGAVVEQFWHAPSVTVESERTFKLPGNVFLTLDDAAHPEWGTGGDHGWRSTAYGRKQEAAFVVASAQTAAAGLTLAAVFMPDRSVAGISVAWEGDEILVRVRGVEAPELCIENGPRIVYRSSPELN